MADGKLNRRMEDERLEQLLDDVATLKRQMEATASTIEHVDDILSSFAVVAAIAKWITTIGAAIGVIWYAITKLPTK